MSYNPVSIDEYQRLLAENERLRAEVVEADEATARMFNLARDLRDEMEGHAEQAEARVRALEAALREMLDVAERLAWYAARAGSVTVGQYDGRIVRARAALARPTPTPDQRQYGKTCAHDGYVVAGCRDCEARATTPTPGEGAGR